MENDFSTTIKNKSPDQSDLDDKIARHLIEQALAASEAGDDPKAIRLLDLAVKTMRLKFLGAPTT